MSEYSSSIPEDAIESLGVEENNGVDIPQQKRQQNNRVSIQLSFSKAREYLDPPKDLENKYTAAMSPESTYKLTSGLLKFLPRQVETNQQRRIINFNFIVAGRSGLGKSTFIRMLFPQQTPVHPVVTSDTKYPVKSTKLNLARYFVQDKGIKADVSAIDTQGFGDYIDNRNCWVPICNYIDKQHMVYMYQEEQPYRSKMVDTRVNACVYFIEHTGRMVSEMDLTAMREISLRANLIPVIAKADCITKDEMKEFKELIKSQLEMNDIKVYQNMDPLGVVCSSAHVAHDGSLSFARTYSYGSINCEDPQFSDYTKLRNLLISENTLDLSTTRIIYFTGTKGLS